MTDFVQGELFPEDVELEPTISMQRGESFVAQCSWCGLLVCASRKFKLGDCPACADTRPEPRPGYKHTWWEQELSVGPFRKPGEDA